MRKNRVINQGFTRSRKLRVDIMYIIYDNMITSRNMNFLIMATTEPLSLCWRVDLQSREWLLKCLTCWPHQHKVQGEGYRSSPIESQLIASKGVGSVGRSSASKASNSPYELGRKDGLRSTVDEMGFLNDNERYLQ